MPAFLLMEEITEEVATRILTFRRDVIGIAINQDGKWWHDPFKVHKVKRMSHGLPSSRLVGFYTYQLQLPKRIWSFLLN